MCTRFVYNGIDKIVGFNFDIDLSVWDHTVITEENRFYIGIKMPDGLYHSFHGINKNGNVGTLLYVHGNENARYIESEDCITISELTEKFIDFLPALRYNVTQERPYRAPERGATIKHLEVNVL